MRTHAPETSAIAIHAQTALDDLRKHPLLRIAVFVLSTVGGYGFCFLIYWGLGKLPLWTTFLHDVVSPLSYMVHTVRVFFGH